MPEMFSCTAEPGTATLVITQTFDAPRREVFEAWTNADEVRLWWDPTGLPLAICEIDLRPDGAFRWINQGEAAKYPFLGTYCEIVPPERLVFRVRAMSEGPDMLTTLIFAEHQDKTTLTMTMLSPSERHRDALLSMRVDQGTRKAMENLKSHLRRRQS